jgi:hypothetical protein
MFGLEKSNRLFEMWSTLTPAVLNLVHQTVKDKTVQQLWAEADQSNDKGM